MTKVAETNSTTNPSTPYIPPPRPTETREANLRFFLRTARNHVVELAQSLPDLDYDSKDTQVFLSRLHSHELVVCILDALCALDNEIAEGRS